MECTNGSTITAPVTQTGTGNIIGSGNVVSITITGYTVEQHEERLTKREAELNAEYKAALKTATEGRKAVEDSFSLRRTALMRAIPYFTTVAGARAATQAIRAIKSDSLDVAPLQSYFKSGSQNSN